jgi:uncharacterized damage-inducible protein DinB
MNAADLRQLFDYHYWARDRVLDAAERLSAADFTRSLGSSFASVRDTLVHLYSSERVWCARWERAPAVGMLDPNAFTTVPSLRQPWRTHEGAMRAVLERLSDDVAQVIEYQDLKGRVWRQTFAEMAQHVVNHGSYHRGQVTTMLRQLGASPAEPMDLIAFYRLRL